MTRTTTRRAVRIGAGLAMALALAASCAHGLAFKRAATTGLQVAEQALTDARKAELALWQRPGTGYGLPQHLAALDRLEAAQAAMGRAARVLAAWDPTQPVPADLDGVAAALAQLRAATAALHLDAAGAVLASVGHALDVVHGLQADLQALKGGGDHD